VAAAKRAKNDANSSARLSLLPERGVASAAAWNACAERVHDMSMIKIPKITHITGYMIFQRGFSIHQTQTNHRIQSRSLKEWSSMHVYSPLLFRLMARPTNIPKAHALQKSLQSNEEAAAIKVAIRAPTAWLSRPFYDA
jgi:hypothetical protein